MKFSEIFAKVKNTDTWNLNDGSYTGKIVDFKLVKDNTFVLLKIEVDEDTVFMNYSPVSRYEVKPLRTLVEPYEYPDELKGKAVEFTVVNNKYSNGKVYSNITKIEYV